MNTSRSLEQGSRIAIFIPALHGGGAERTMLNLANGLAQRGYSVDLVLARATGPYLAQVAPDVRVVDLGAPRVLASLPALVRYLRRERPHSLLSALDYANIVALWARQLAGTPGCVVINEQNTLSRTSQNTPRWRGRLVPRLARRFYPWAQGIVAVSQGVAADLSDLTAVPLANIQVIYNPIITPDLETKVQAPLEHPWFGPDEPPVVLAVGRLTIQKDFPSLLAAFARVRQQRPARLIILGEGPDRPQLEQLVASLGLEDAVRLPGFVDNPYAYMARASLFALSSRWEGLPTVLIEALYCGVPVVATNCPSGPQEILAGGRYGRLVPVGDVPALAQAMTEALADTAPPPPVESWQPYALDTIIDRYVDTFWRAA